MPLKPLLCYPRATWAQAREGVINWEQLPPSGGVPHGGSRLEPEGAAGEGPGGEVAFLLQSDTCLLAFQSEDCAGKSVLFL